MKKQKKSRYNPESPFPEQHSVSVAKRWKGTDRRLGENRTTDYFQTIVIGENDFAITMTVPIPKSEIGRIRKTLDTQNYFGQGYTSVSVFGEPEEKDLPPATDWETESYNEMTGVRYSCGHTVVSQTILSGAEEQKIREHALTIPCPDCVAERTKREHKEWTEKMARLYGGEPGDY
jgi:hypothetical protein